MPNALFILPITTEYGYIISSTLIPRKAAFNGILSGEPHGAANTHRLAEQEDRSKRSRTHHRKSRQAQIAIQLEQAGLFLLIHLLESICSSGSRGCCAASPSLRRGKSPLSSVLILVRPRILVFLHPPCECEKETPRYSPIIGNVSSIPVSRGL